MIHEPLPICLDKKTQNQFYDEILVGRFTRISFNRTLRIPEDGRDYPLPAGLGRLPIHRVEDYADKVPEKWLEEGGFFIPLYQKEAMYLEFKGPEWHPSIAKVCVGKVNAITGNPFSKDLSKIKQDYVVIPEQRWLDGICSGEGLVKQFVAMPLGQGYTIEAQITDEEKFGGFQILVFDAVDGKFPDRDPDIDESILQQEEDARKGILYQLGSATMGVAAGGSIKQQIFRDTYGVDSWDTQGKSSLIIHLVNSLEYKSITGLEPPVSPITASEYQQAKIPWCSFYDELAPTIEPPSVFKRIVGVTGIEKLRGIIHQDSPEVRNLIMEKLTKIPTPNKYEAAAIYRSRAKKSIADGRWNDAIRECSYVIDLDANTCANDYVYRSYSNYNIGRFRDGSIDATLGLEIDAENSEALIWRAFCRKMLGEHQELDEDASALLKLPETEIVGLEMKAEAALMAGKYEDALNTALILKAKRPTNIRAEEICNEAKGKIS